MSVLLMYPPSKHIGAVEAQARASLQALQARRA
jgi:hypothetical protein